MTTLAYAELAIAYTLSISDQYGELTWPETQALSIPLARKTMELDPMLSEAHAAAGMVIWNVAPSPSIRFLCTTSACKVLDLNNGIKKKIIANRVKRLFSPHFLLN